MFKVIRTIRFSTLSECAPMTSFYVILTGDEIHDAGLGGFPKSGFRCDPCDFKQSLMCTNCSLCNVGSYSDQGGSCFECPAGKLTVITDSFLFLCFYVCLLCYFLSTIKPQILPRVLLKEATT